MTATGTCPRCGGFRFPPAYVGDVIGPICNCWEDTRYRQPIQPTPNIFVYDGDRKPVQPDDMRLPTVSDIRKIVKEEIEKALKKERDNK